ncbi:MAG: hypothetical protein KIS67_02480 [Verrucomicrobiae bacterium]|nr:hypothetical protein [Verrucomicrobiae bacterium]
MKLHGDMVRLEKSLRPLARGPSPDLARALVHLTADNETHAITAAL